MRTATPLIISVALALAVTACSDEPPEREVAAPPPAAASESTPDVSTGPADDAASDVAPPADQPSQPDPQILEPLPSTKPPADEPQMVDGAFTASTTQPPLERMRVANPVGKIGPPVDVRYNVEGVFAKGQPVTLQLAFVPRLDGRNLRVEFPESAGMTFASAPAALASAKASRSDVLRHAILVTPKTDSAEVRAIVSIDVGEARYAGTVSIPLGAQGVKTAGKKPPQG
jgi:hypothetical protein